MLGGIPLARILGMAAGILILAVGVFVLRAKPQSSLHRLFFALAIVDGVSTFAFNVANAPIAEFVRLQFVLVYYVAFVAFLTLLIIFALHFPRPLLPRDARRIAYGAIIALGAIALGAMLYDYNVYWAPVRRNGEILIELTAAGRTLLAAFVLATAFVILRATYLIRRENSPTHRRQGALILGGMAIGYAPFSTTTVILGLRRVPETFLSPQWDLAMAYWAALVTVVCAVVAAVVVGVEFRADRRVERNIVLSGVLGVLVVSMIAVPAGSRAVADGLQMLGLAVYPVLLGYAIARYEVLDIDAHVRRAATASLAGASFTAAFLLFEIFLEQWLQRIVSTEVSVTLFAGLIAALLTALISVPLIRVARRLARRVAPRLVGEDDVDVRKREIYRHALHGAAADGVIAPQELRVLQRLRESLQISDDEHTTMMRELGSGVTITGS